MLDSPLHYWAAYLSPERVKEQQDCFDFGTAYHTYVLEPDKFSQTIAVIPEGIDRRTKVGKAAWEAFQSESAGKVCIKQPDMDSIQGDGRCRYLPPYRQQDIPLRRGRDFLLLD